MTLILLRKLKTKTCFWCEDLTLIALPGPHSCPWQAEVCRVAACRFHQEGLLYRDKHWKIHQLISHRDGRGQKSSTNHVQHFLLFVVICFVLFQVLVAHLTEHRAWQASPLPATHILSPTWKIVTVKLENCKEKDQIHNCPVKALLNTAQEYGPSLGPYLGFTENGAELGYSGAHKDKAHSSSHLHPMAARQASIPPDILSASVPPTYVWLRTSCVVGATNLVHRAETK